MPKGNGNNKEKKSLTLSWTSDFHTPAEIRKGKHEQENYDRKIAKYFHHRWFWVLSPKITLLN